MHRQNCLMAKKTYILALAMLTSVVMSAQVRSVKVDFGMSTTMRSWHSSTNTHVQLSSSPITVDYTMLVGKSVSLRKEGTENMLALVNETSDTLLVQIRQFRDGMAFRYVLPHALEGEMLLSDLTSYSVPSSARRWLQQYNGPGYEHFYPLCEGGISPEGSNITRWGQPALLETGKDEYVLITESNVMRGNCGSILVNSEDDRNCYEVELFDKQLPLHSSWTSPWHVVISGTLADVVESTMVTDVADECVLDDVSWIEPGVSSWVYWANNHGSQEYEVLKQYVDLAADMHWPYTLIDAEWDMMRGGNIEQIVSYSLSKGVKPMIWYNSTTNWTGKWAPSPQGLLNDAESREREFAKIASWGVKGVKIDFFRDDNAETINYYIDLLECAAKHHLLVNFHGGTVPRGWQRIYPNLISCESVYGAEWYNNAGVLTPKAAQHNATLPFTRNVIGSMDYTPGTFTDSQHPHITTHAHELALTILFESGIQHMPDRPSAYASLPGDIRQMLSSLPTAWDETRLLAGAPGESVVLARRKGSKWYVAGINGKDTPQTIQFTLPLPSGRNSVDDALFISDGYEQTSFNISHTQLSGSMCVSCAPRGGFVIVM